MKINEIAENISYTSKRIHDIEREKNVEPGTPEWFKLWFSLPYLKESLNEEVEVSLYGDAEKGYTLSKIEVSGDERNAGQGTQAMQDIVDRMDREGAVIALTPDDAFGGNKNRLIKFYKRFGFVPNKGRNKDFRFRETMIRYPQTNEGINEGYKLQLERDTDMMVLNITDTVTGKRTEVRGKAGYETNGYDADDKLHKLLDKISKSANISELMNGEVVGINPKHPKGASANAAATTAFNEAFDNPYKFKVTENNNNRWQAQAVTDNNIIISFLATNVDTGWGIDFKTANADTPNNTTYDLTGKGDGQRTMTTVLAMLKKFIQDHSPKEIYFDAAKDAGNSRTNLYQKIVQRFAGGLGYTVDVQDAGNRDDFTLVKKVQEATVTEALDNPYPFKLSGPNTDNTYFAKAQTPNGELVMEFDGGYDDFSIDFAIGNEMGKTDAGDQFRVFATVVAMMNKWISVVGIEHVEAFDFAANKEEHASDGRARLYSRFAKKLASQLGWSLQQSSTGNDTTEFFNLVNPKPVERPAGYFDALDDGKLGPNGEIPAEYNESVAEATTNAMPRWKRVGNDGEMEIAFPTRKFRIEKFYDTNMKTGDIGHKGAWLVFEWDPQSENWEWHETYSPKWYAKEQVMKMSAWDNNGKKVVDYSDASKSESTVAEAEDTLTLPKISVGDEVMVGKFKNRKAEVKGFSKDDHNQPVLKTTKGDQKLFKPRLSKLMKEL